MQWFNSWWAEIGLIGQIMACAAIPMTIVLLLQMVLLLIGAGFGDDTDAEFDEFDGDFTEHTADCADSCTHEPHSGGGGPKIFTIRGITAFFAIGGWAGLAVLTAGVPKLICIIIALTSGALAMEFAALVLRWALRMQSSGNINPKNAVSKTGSVYLTIPAGGDRTGKVTLLLQDRLVEMEAVTDCEYPIKTNTQIVVTGVLGESCLIVKPVEDA